MPILLDTPQKIRAVQNLPFCYLCGAKFKVGEKPKPNSDHVPPKRLFLEPHRDFPLVLKTHQACNGGHSGDDQTIQQLVGVLHGMNIHDHKGGQLTVKPTKLPDGTLTVVTNAPMRNIIRRWLRGFHAALYREFLPEAFDAVICPPLPEGMLKDGKIHPVEPQEVISAVVDALKHNRKAQRIDSIVTRKGHCRYEATWGLLKRDNVSVGRACAFALDIYDWKQLGENEHFEERGCMGLYIRADGSAPPSAALALDVEGDGKMGGARLDPFGEG